MRHDAHYVDTLAASAATPVGRWGGLDYFIHHLVVRPVFRKREKR